MEDKSFSWVLQTIAGRQSNLPILSTYIINEGKPITLINNKDNKLLISIAQVKTVKDLYMKLLSDHQFKNKLHSIGNLVCYIITKKERIRATETDLKEMLEQGTNKILQYVQPARPNADEFEVYYILRLEYTRTHYVSHFFQQVNYEKTSFYEPRLFELACDIGSTVMSILESHTKKRVMILEIEFLEDSNRSIWISFFRDIKLAEPILCQHFLVNTPDDLKAIPIKSHSSTKLAKLTNGQHIMERKRNIKPPIDYTFVKGHIRNKHSNFANDLSILAPASGILEKSQRSNSKIFLRTISIKKCGIRASNSQPRSNSKLNAKRARALRDEIMKSPELKTKFRLTGLIGVFGIEVEEKGIQRSLSDSDLIEETRELVTQRKRPTSRLILRESASPKFGRNTPQRKYKK